MFQLLMALASVSGERSVIPRIVSKYTPLPVLTVYCIALPIVIGNHNSLLSHTFAVSKW